MRWAQLTLVENDPGRFDPGFWLDYFKRVHADAACLSAGGIVAYYPTDVPLHHRSAWLKDTDPFGELVKGCKALGMHVIATKGRPDPVLAAEDSLDWLGGADQLGELLARADYVAVCAPLTDATRGLIGAAQFAQMKPDAYLINIARGPVVDEQALYEALRDRRIAGAAIDVWYNYPPNGQGRPGNFPFEELDNLVMTPHVAGWTEGMLAARAALIAENIDRAARGERPVNAVA